MLAFLVNTSFPLLSGSTVKWGGFSRIQPVLETLELTDVGLLESGTVRLCLGLESNKSLTSLSLAQNSMGDKGAAAVSPSCIKAPKLTFLDLSSNMLPTGQQLHLQKRISRYRVAQVIGTHQCLLARGYLAQKTIAAYPKALSMLKITMQIRLQCQSLQFGSQRR